MKSGGVVVSYLIIVGFFGTLSSAEYFTSTSHLKMLLKSEQQLALKLKDFISFEERRINKLRMFYEKIEFLGKITSTRDINSYVGHPVQAFLTLRRMVKDWPVLLERTTSNKEKNFHSLIEENNYMFPTNEDMEGAKDALLRLQETFSLSAHEIVEGISKDVPIAKLGAEDAFDIGRKTYLQSKHDITTGWMREALRLLEVNRGVNDGAPTRYEVLDHLAWSEYVSNDVESAFKHAQELLKLDPENERFKSNVRAFWKEMNETVNSNGEEHVSNQTMKAKKQRKRKYPRFYYTSDEDERVRYFMEKKRSHELCRGETEPIPKRHTSQLVCWYKTGHPLLVLKPAKVERVFPKPEILFFRDAISDKEIEKVKILAHPLLQRATVHNPVTGKLEFADYRTSKSAWLDESHDVLVEVMNRRIDAYTGLNMETAEKLQVANYGMGGHYETHFDFARRTKAKEREMLKENGNRIATVLFYMSDVERGGATVFTNIGQAVKPSKGDAVFWFNLHHDGTGDYDTRHAACPVLLGEKWVSNRWIHEHGQEFRRPCKLNLDDRN